MTPGCSSLYYFLVCSCRKPPPPPQKKHDNTTPACLRLNHSRSASWVCREEQRIAGWNIPIFSQYYNRNITIFNRNITFNHFHRGPFPASYVSWSRSVQLTAFAHENWWLEDWTSFILGFGLFSGAIIVTFREGILCVETSKMLSCTTSISGGFRQWYCSVN